MFQWPASLPAEPRQPPSPEPTKTLSPYPTRRFTPESSPQREGSVAAAAPPAPRSWSIATAASEMEYGVNSIQGRKSSNPNWVNQDNSLVMPLPATAGCGERILVAVMDGHGSVGHKCSGHIRNAMQQVAPSLLAGSAMNSPAAFTKLFLQLCKELDNQAQLSDSGSTLTMAVVDPAARTFSCAHVGDSTLIAVQDGNVIFETQDHRIDAAAEQRVKQCGGAVYTTKDGNKRVFYPDPSGKPTIGLTLDRSLGDVDLRKAGVIPEPTVNVNVPLPVGGALVLASDGVWDVTSKGLVAKCMATTPDPEEAAKTLTTRARSQWEAIQSGGSIDDITALVLAC